MLFPPKSHPPKNKWTAAEAKYITLLDVKRDVLHGMHGFHMEAALLHARHITS